MATVQPEQRLRLSLIPWETYVTYSDGLGPRHIRVTYDQGEMEIMTVSPRHENNKKRLAQLIEALTEEMDIERASFGSMTCRREELLRGLEPDEAYWIQNESVVRDRDDLDLDVDPPPDLVLDVEISRSTLDRMGIYAALKVPEVWRWDGEKLLVCLLGRKAIYTVSERSKAFPFLPLEDLVGFMKRSGGETAVVRSFRKWVREQQAAGWKKS